jgi:hypothetical protein
MAKKEDTEIYIKENDSYKPTELTAYCIDKVYGQIAHALGLKPFFEFEQRESIENFLYHLYPGQQKTSQTY